MCFDHPAATGPSITAPEDVLRGYTLCSPPALCTSCHRSLRAGMDCTVYAYHLADSPAWDVPRVFCTRCAPERIDTPTLGAIEVLADCTLATQSRPDMQSHRLCLVAPTVTAHSGPDAGAPA